jgi:hypothetical protein
LHDDGVIYPLENDVRVKVQRKSATRVRVSMQRGNVFVPPETGDLGSGAFRLKLVNLARERFGGVNGLADELDLIAVGFDAHLKEREEAAAQDDNYTNTPELVGTPYRIVNGGFVRLKNTQEGEIPRRLTNFTARVEEEVIRDDGAETKRIYRIVGKAGERSLPKTDVPATQFGSLNWVSEEWGLAARITAGQGAKDYTREAIELLSEGATTRHVHAHTGWRVPPAGGELAYLHAGGAIGAEDVEVELEPGLERYALPTPGPPEELAEAVRQSLAFLEVAPERVTAPLLGAAYLAPLSEIVVPDFTLWLWGGTGSFKSTLAALTLSHFGTFTEEELPISFESTPNFVERILFLLKDTLAVVDDWRPAVSRADASEMDKRAQRLLRTVGNRQGRGRMTSDTMLRRTYPPRGMVIATAEALPEGPAFESAAARSLSVNLLREEVDLRQLSELQRHRAMLSKAMAGYIQWVAPRYETLFGELLIRRDLTRDKVCANLVGAHPRTPGAAAALIVGLELLQAYAVNVGVVERAEADEFFACATAGVIEAAKAHIEATKGGDPATRFIELLRSLFSAGKAYLKDRGTGIEPPGWQELGWEENNNLSGEMYRPKSGAEFVGWADDMYLYLDREAAYAAVAAFAQRGAIPFGIKQRALWGALKRAEITLTDSGRTDTTASIGGKSKRVIQLPRKIIFDGDEL